MPEVVISWYYVGLDYVTCHMSETCTKYLSVISLAVDDPPRARGKRVERSARRGVARDLLRGALDDDEDEDDDGRDGRDERSDEWAHARCVVGDRHQSRYEFAVKSRRWVLALVPTVRVVRNRVAALARGTSRGFSVFGRGWGGND